MKLQALLIRLSLSAGQGYETFHGHKKEVQDVGGEAADTHKIKPQHRAMKATMGLKRSTGSVNLPGCG